MLRAVYEGIVFSHKMHIDKLLNLRDIPDAVRIAGGVVAGIYSSLNNASKVFSKVVRTHLPDEENKLIYEEK